MVGRISGEQDELMRPGIANPAWATASPVGGVAAVVATSSVAAMAPTPTVAAMACPLCYHEFPSQQELEQHASYCRQ